MHDVGSFNSISMLSTGKEI